MIQDQTREASPAASNGEAPLTTLEPDPRVLSRDFDSLLGQPWDPARASELHELVDELAAAADAADLGDLAEKAIALSVFLCSFVDGDRLPTAEHRAQLRELVRMMAPASSAESDTNAHAAPSAGSQLHGGRAILVLGHDDRLARSLSREPVLANYEVLAIEDPKAATELAARFTKLCLLVEPSALGSVHQVMHELAQHQSSSGERALCMAIVPRENTPQRLGALRAGAHFVIRDGLPAHDLAAELKQRLEADSGHHFRVFIVDDDRGQATFCESVLKHRGLLTQICTDPEQALAGIESFKPDVVLVDLHMPTMSGIELTARIREQRGRDFIPIIFLSGEEDRDAQLDAIAIGGDAFLMKPILPRHLVSEVMTRAQRARDLKHGIDRARYGGI